MKKIFTIFVLMAASINMQAQKKQTIASIEYESFSRRNQTNLKITADSVIVTTRTDAKYILTKANQWKKITAIVKKIKLASVPSYKSPTKKREYDGAAHCKISIATKNKKYESQYFDSGYPMKQLKTLYNAIEEIRNLVEGEGKQYNKPS